MKVHRLKVHNFRILGGSPLDLDFPTGRIGIFGPNEVGKSSLLDAIEVALFGVGAGRKAAGAERGEMVTWGRDAIDLTLEFSSGLERYRIRRNIGRRHEAEFYQIVGDEETLLSSSVAEIQETVASTIGMDREAFEKLVYVRQKDLDALRDVAKANREAMMNKVMGMEVFDEAIADAKVDLRVRVDDRKVAESQLSAAEQDWLLHSQRLGERERVLLTSKEVATKLADARKRETDAERQVAVLEWLKDEKAKKDLQTELANKLADLNAQNQDLEAKSKRLIDVKAALRDLGFPEQIEASLRRRGNALALRTQREDDANEARRKFRLAELEVTKLREHRALAQKVTRLLELRINLRAMQTELEKEQSQLSTMDSEIAAEEKKAGLKAEETSATRADIPATKKRLLTAFGGSLLAGIGALALGFLFYFPIALVGVGLLAGAGWAFAKFLRLERLAERALGLVAQVEQRKSLQKRAKESEGRLAHALVQAGIRSVDDLENETEELLKGLAASTGISRPEAFEDALRQREHEQGSKEDELNRLGAEIQKLETVERGEDSVYPVPPGTNLNRLLQQIQGKVVEKQNLEATVKALEEEVRAVGAKAIPKKLDLTRRSLDQLEAAMGKHVSRRPAEAQGREYSEEENLQRLASLRTVQVEVKELSGDQRAIQEGLRRIEEDLERTKQGFERYPVLKERFGQLSEEVRVLDRVAEEIRATGAELRAKVLPAARYILNQLLPVITDGRYTDLEISEDFQFQAYSSEAGGFKKRDVFSGGTQDQFLIALRLAFTKAILDSRVRADEYSLFLDECTASSDDVRKQAIFQVLDSMKATFSQIFIVAHEDISSFVDHHLALERGVDGYTVLRARSWAD